MFHCLAPPWENWIPVKKCVLPLILFRLRIAACAGKIVLTFKSIARLNAVNILIQILLAWVTNSCITDEKLEARSFGHSSGLRSNVPAFRLNDSLKSPTGDFRSELVKQLSYLNAYSSDWDFWLWINNSAFSIFVFFCSDKIANILHNGNKTNQLVTAETDRLRYVDFMRTT